ncbi:MAG: glycosyltransferase family 2 protein [Rhodospirillales bacterium]|nr:glycosyltransferase family 2 protein [Acetobacter sp.]
MLYKDKSLQQSCFRFPTPAGAWAENLGLAKLFRRYDAFNDYRGWDHATEREVDFVIGACLLLRREVYEQVGGFDEQFFMYQEEADWQKRIRAKGWQIAFTPTAEVIHLAGASGRAEPVRVKGHFFESLDKYVCKHHGVTGFLLVRGAMLVGCTARAVGWAAVALAAPRHREAAIRRAWQHVQLVARQLLTGLPAGRHA